MNNELTKMVKSWSELFNEEIITVKKLSTAYSNHVFFIETVKGKYIYKKYITGTDTKQRRNEIYIEEKIGIPIIIKKEIGFRIEKFIEHEIVNFRLDLSEIAKALRDFHSLEINCDYQHCYLLDQMLENNKDLEGLQSIQKVIKKIKELNVNKKHFSLCHNDLQVGNMLKVDDKIIFIDFETCCLGNKFIDIANFFCETMASYEEDSILKVNRGYSEEEKVKFLQVYFEKEDVSNEMSLINEAMCFSHFYWFLWGRYFARCKEKPSESFEYEKYYLCRLKFLVDMHLLTNNEYEEIIKIK